MTQNLPGGRSARDGADPLAMTRVVRRAARPFRPLKDSLAIRSANPARADAIAQPYDA